MSPTPAARAGRAEKALRDLAKRCSTLAQELRHYRRRHAEDRRVVLLADRLADRVEDYLRGLLGMGWRSESQSQDDDIRRVADAVIEFKAERVEHVVNDSRAKDP